MNVSLIYSAFPPFHKLPHTQIQFLDDLINLQSLFFISFIFISFLYFFVFPFFNEVQLICNNVLDSGAQHSDSVTYIYIHTYILFQILFPYRLLQDIEYSSLCYTVGPYWLSILYIVVCIC